MASRESLYPNDWLLKGDNDLNAAEILLKAENLGSAAFHIQQAIEKYLKGYLIFKGWRLRRIHELDELLDEAASFDPALERFRSLCEIATEFYIEERYPLLISSELNRDELEKIFKETQELIKFIRGNKDGK